MPFVLFNYFYFTRWHSLSSGTPCNNYQGICDTFSRCTATANETPLQDLRDLILTKNVQYNVQSWIYVSY